MVILWLSEIKWSYLRTRKQQILSRFPADDTILFVEPIAKRASNRVWFTHEPPVHIVTIPHIRAVANPGINYLLERKFVRRSIRWIAGVWLDLILKSIREQPDVLVLSNVYWSMNVRAIKERWPQLPVVYECNDNPLGFPRTPGYKRTYVQETLELADLITTPHVACVPADPEQYADKIRIVSNGVDVERFASAPESTPLDALPRPVIMYVGAVSEWFDFQQVQRVAEHHTGATVVLIGPVADTVRVQAQQLLDLSNVKHIPPVPYHEIMNYLASADVCIIPFVANELTRPVIPNKLFEYAAAGKTTVAGHFNPDLKEFAHWAYISESDEDFMRKLEMALSKPLPEDDLRSMAARYDWDIISRTFRDHLVSLLADRPSNR
ncbi:MAG: glycosyltransferase [Fidelibacterota bacterium]|nr:MAG: glycosyltransferase [Candidatus Neomarinimicrobiota bacterium]